MGINLRHKQIATQQCLLTIRQLFLTYNNELTLLVANIKQFSQREIRTAAEFILFHYYQVILLSLPQTLHPFILCSKYKGLLKMYS